MAEALLADYFEKFELAEELHKSPRTLDRWERLRIGPPSVIVGTRRLYLRDGVRHWLAAGGTKAKPAPKAKPERRRAAARLSRGRG